MLTTLYVFSTDPVFNKNKDNKNQLVEAQARPGNINARRTGKTLETIAMLRLWAFKFLDMPLGSQ